MLLQTRQTRSPASRRQLAEQLPDPRSPHPGLTALKTMPRVSNSLASDSWAEPLNTLVAWSTCSAARPTNLTPRNSTRVASSSAPLSRDEETEGPAAVLLAAAGRRGCEFAESGAASGRPPNHRVPRVA